MNGKRITIVLDLDIERTLRRKQAKKLTESDGSVSFSSIVNEELRKHLKMKPQ